MEKKTTANKAAKAKQAAKKKTTEKKPAAPKAKAINWDEQPENVTLVGTGTGKLKKGQEYPATKANAMLIVAKGFATLK